MSSLQNKTQSLRDRLVLMRSKSVRKARAKTQTRLLPQFGEGKTRESRRTKSCSDLVN